MTHPKKNTVKETLAITALSACIMLGAVGAYRLTEGSALKDDTAKAAEATDTKSDSASDVPLDSNASNVSSNE